jgi:hypothetical protein
MRLARDGRPVGVGVFNHEPEGYRCPFCRVLSGVDSAANTQRDIVCRTHDAAALIAPRWWPNNHGHVLVVPTAHHENLYEVRSCRARRRPPDRDRDAQRLRL